jgi:hypothetical protein
MAGFVGTPSPINRMLGFADVDDATGLPAGLAALARNCDFELTSVRTRNGINLQAGGVPAGIQALFKKPVTGLMGLTYTPEKDTESFFQLPLLYQTTDDDSSGSLQGEFVVGSGVTLPITSPLIILPAKAHMLGAQAYNKAWMAFSDLISPLGPGAVYNLQLNALDPYGMKPFGWVWLPNTPVFVGETCTPPVPGGNGHVYRCIADGVTGPAAPAFAVNYGGQFVDGTTAWEEKTPVIANRLESPVIPIIALAAGGTFTPGDTVYIVETFINTIGETAASLPSSVVITPLDTAVSVTVPSAIDATFPPWMTELAGAYYPQQVRIYVAVSSSGPPPLSAYAYYAQVPLGSGAALVLGPSSGSPPPSGNTARITPGQLPNPIVAPSAIRDAQVVLSWSLAGKPPAGVVYPVPSIGTPVPQLVTFPIDFAGSSGSCGTNPTRGGGSPPTFGIGPEFFTPFGVVRISTAGVFSFDTSGVAPVLQKGQQMSVYTPSPQDSTLSDVSLTFLGNATGLFPAGRDVYVRQTYLNVTGETKAGPSSSVINTNQNDGVLVTVPNPGNLTYTGIGIYECDVPTGAPEPDASSFSLVGFYQANDVLVIAQSATGKAPPPTNQSGPGGAIAPDTATGGIGATQGYRYCGIQLLNRNQSLSGFTKASVVKAIIDQAGWQISVFNLGPGPSNIAARYASFSEADGTDAGPFFVIGDYAPGLPTNFVYPMTQLSADEPMSATIIPDNTTESATFNFSDEYLIAATSVTDRLRVIWPNPCVDMYYAPSTDRMIQTGVPGFNGHWVSLAADPESYYGADSSFVPTSSSAGERAICAREFRGVLYSLRERSGFTMQIANIDDLGNVTWDVQQRWSEVGPCGPRAVACCGRFMIFVHRSGIYKYDPENPKPEPVHKEIPRWWQSINWNAAQCVSVAIDEEKEVVRIQVPAGQSTVPNQEILLFYKEGWNTPIHFSTFASKEISMDMARRFAINDVCAFIGVRIERTIPNPQPNLEGDEGIPLLEQSFYSSQFLYASSGPDGAVPAITPGVFHDGEAPNQPGTGIDWQYETVAPPSTMAFSKIEGYVLNARGNGPLLSYLLAGRKQVTDWTSAGPAEMKGIIRVRPIDLTPNNMVGDTRMVPSKFGEAWRVRFTNGKVPDVWAELKNCILYSIPLSSGRPESQK